MFCKYSFFEYFRSSRDGRFENIASDILACVVVNRGQKSRPKYLNFQRYQFEFLGPKLAARNLKSAEPRATRFARRRTTVFLLCGPPANYRPARDALTARRGARVRRGAERPRPGVSHTPSKAFRTSVRLRRVDQAGAPRRTSGRPSPRGRQAPAADSGVWRAFVPIPRERRRCSHVQRRVHRS